MKNENKIENLNVENDLLDRDSMKKKLPEFSFKNVLIVILPALAVIIAAVIVLTTTKKASSYSLKEDGYQTYAGAVKDIPGGTELIRSEDGTAAIIHGKDHETITNLPIYYKNSNGLVLPEDWLYYNARRGTKTRADYFSEISTGDVNEIHAKRGSKDVIASSGFVFDGSNSYVFTEPVRISYNGYEIDLAPFSFAEVVYGEQIVIYEYESGKEYMDIPQTDVIAEQVSGDYSVSLTYDMLQYPDGTAMLLFTRPDLVDSIYDDK